MADNKSLSDRVTSCNDASIVVSGVSKKFGKTMALSEVDLTVEAGTIVALLGPNGAGKTTLVRILTTLLKPDTGKATVAGYDIAKQPHQVRSMIGLAGQYPAVDENLTGRENLEMIGQLYHLSRKVAKERSLQLLKNFDLLDAANRRAKTYSGGMRRRLDLAAAILASPPILFLDEPTTGLDPRSRIGLWEVIADQAKGCKTVFLTTQYLEEADKLANKIVIIDRGRVLRQGTNQELKDCCGGDTVINVRLNDRTKISEAAAALNGLDDGKLHSDEKTGEISLPTTAGSALVSEVVRRLDGAGIQIAEIGLKQPTLDDVFLTLTGHTSEETSEKAKPSSKESSRRQMK